MSESLLAQPASPAVTLLSAAVGIEYFDPQESLHHYETPVLAGGVALAGLFRDIEPRRSSTQNALPLLHAYFDPSGDSATYRAELTAEVRELRSDGYQLAAAIIVGQAQDAQDGEPHRLPATTAAEMVGYRAALVNGARDSSARPYYAHYYPGENYRPHAQSTLVPARLAISIICGRGLLLMQPRIGSSVLRVPHAPNSIPRNEIPVTQNVRY